VAEATPRRSIRSTLDRRSSFTLFFFHPFFFRSSLVRVLSVHAPTLQIRGASSRVGSGRVRSGLWSGGAGAGADVVCLYLSFSAPPAVQEYLRRTRGRLDAIRLSPGRVAVPLPVSVPLAPPGHIRFDTPAVARRPFGPVRRCGILPARPRFIPASCQ